MLRLINNIGFLKSKSLYREELAENHFPALINLSEKTFNTISTVFKLEDI